MRKYNFIIILLLSLFLFTGFSCAKKNTVISNNFLYQRSSDIIPETYSITEPDNMYSENNSEPVALGEDLLYQAATYKFYCRSNNEEAKKIEYYSTSAKPNIIGAWSQRFALVCGDKYYIRDGDDRGWKTYGPFYLK
jgi:hypothetical protein